MFDSEACQKFVEKLFDQSALPSLVEYVKIPNLSRTFDSEWDSNGRLQAAAEHIRKWVQQIGIKGLKTEVIQDKGYSPLIFTEIQGDIPETIFFYGHYDKQPAFNGWDEGLGATTPVIKNGKLYGRGGADDGYATYGTMLAIKAVQDQGLPIPRCVMVTEGDEESGSGHMPHYLETLEKRIGNPKIFFCLDSGTLDYDRLWLTNSLRGNLVATLKIKVLKEGVHSGDASGIVPNVFRIAKQLLGRIQNPVTGEINPAFHVEIPAEFYEQNYDLAQTKGQQAIKAFPFLEGCQALSKNPLDCLLNRAWRPTLTVTGQTGFPEAIGSGNVMHPEIQMRISIRLPPTLNGLEAEQSLKKIILENPPYNAKVEVTDVRAGFGWTAPAYEQFLTDAIKESSNIYYKQPMLNNGQGGSIPLMNTLSKMWPEGQFLITGVLGPNSNAHGPNEFLHLDYTKKLVCCMAHVLAKASERYGKKQ